MDISPQRGVVIPLEFVKNGTEGMQLLNHKVVFAFLTNQMVDQQQPY